MNYRALTHILKNKCEKIWKYDMQLVWILLQDDWVLMVVSKSESHDQ